MQRFIRVYFSWLSILSFKMAGDQAFELFQRTFRPKNRFRKREMKFYSEVAAFKTTVAGEQLNCYEWGNDSGELVFLVHGWNSNAGSMYSIATELVKQGFYVVSLDLPAHGHSHLKKTNLVNCSAAFRQLVHRMLPDRPFSVVSHSFGSAVVSHALAGSRFKVKRWVMLTTPNQMTAIFEEYRDLIGLKKQAYSHLKKRAEYVLKAELENVSVQQLLQQIDYEQLLLIHDEADRMLPISNSRAIHKACEQSQLIPLKQVGHYRMLSHPKVIQHVQGFLSPVFLEEWAL